MSIQVIDASVAAKWFFPAEDEPNTNEALELLERGLRGEVRFVVPDLFWPEFGNILCKAVRRERVSNETAVAALQSLRELDLPTLSCVELLEAAYEIATKFGRSFYDAVYVALAVSVRGELVTADERLANALAARLPVKWLGGI